MFAMVLWCQSNDEDAFSLILDCEFAGSPLHLFGCKDSETNGVLFGRFGDDCVHTHPQDQRVKLNRAGFPLRLGRPNCPQYMKTAFCPSMKACNRNHPNLEYHPSSAGAAAGDGSTGAPAPLPMVLLQTEKLRIFRSFFWVPIRDYCDIVGSTGACPSAPVLCNPGVVLLFCLASNE